MPIVPTSASASFPGCALSCTTLLQAEQICMPPNQPQAGQLVYDQCFCNSAFLTPFATTADGVCVTECAIPSDRLRLQSWFNNFCAQVSSGVDPTTLTATSSQAAATTVTTTSTATSGTVTVTPTSTSASSSSSSPDQNQSWIEGHWKWILMLVILAIGLALLAWLAVWLKRRHRRKLENLRATASGFSYDPEKRPANGIRRSATPDLWGPHQMMQATQGYGYASDEIVQAPKEDRHNRSHRGTEAVSRPEKDVIEIADIEKNAASLRPSNKRARPSELEVNARMIGAADRRSKSRTKNRRQSQKRTVKEVEAGFEQRLSGTRSETSPVIPHKT
ncbi:hypothetical protein LTR05_006575 [Lithohypha guttulata]|uniref:Integral membrane protein n=1 Tax=Lithohypha guttulata TaxID=1690604 RepID=A0AAN7SVI1_9EURO|nr:hypothetical protein LTR05_006575 [Lithohypha guttulata]